MLKIIKNMKDLDFQQLMEVYAESVALNGKEFYPDLEPSLQILREEESFYAFLRIFFQRPDAFYAVNEQDGKYVSALRLESFNDGLLLEALETAPEYRQKGFGKELVRQALSYAKTLGYHKVYSHISRRNRASINLHLSCGFHKILDHAVYIDGSVSHNADTYLIVLE